MKKVYLDYAATTPVRAEVVEAMAPYWQEEFGNPSSLHLWGTEARKAVEEAREKVATLINASPEEIVFTGSTTTSDNLAIFGVINALKSKTGQFLTSQIEHHAVLDVFKQLENQGFEVNFLPVDKNGVLNLEALRGAIGPQTILVSIMWANNEIGTIQPIGEISKTIKAVNEELGSKTYFHTDAATIVEYLPINVRALGVDLLSLGPHKFGGPKGIGILYVKTGTKIKPITFGGHQENSLWPGTEAVPLIVGTAKAMELATQERKTLDKRVKKLQDKLVKGVVERIPGSFLTGDKDKRLPDIVSFVFPGVEGEAILLRLSAEGIAASSGSACTSGELKPSHVLLAMGVSAEQAHGSVRFSLGRETTEKEIDYVLEKLPKIIAELRALAPELCLETKAIP
ncbi:MAG TPA: cysteine desulfurase family protein [Clostridia bacterium]|nr:cysteine desulfurase family protein [Clostridia bacterium]